MSESLPFPFHKGEGEGGGLPSFPPSLLPSFAAAIGYLLHQIIHSSVTQCPPTA
jgi:hypothetical protein